MVAGMVMPLADLRAIYELLFRDGVMVTKKDKRPQCMHPEIPGVANLKVIRAMGSLKSRGFVRETFAWKHAYYYLTNEGIVYLRDYLRLPPEIVPSSLQRIRRPASTLDVMRRAARVQTVEGPTSYVPKPRAGVESQEAMVDRQGYRHKRGPGEEEAVSDKPPMRFRGSYQPRGPAGGEPGVQTQTFFRRGQGFRRGGGEERGGAPEQGQGRGGFRTSYLPPESRAVRSQAPVREVKPPTPEVPVAAPVQPEIPVEVPVAAPVEPEIPQEEESVAAPVELEIPQEESIAAPVELEIPQEESVAAPVEPEITQEVSVAVEAAETEFVPEEEPEPVEEAPAPVVESVVEEIQVQKLVEEEEEEDEEDEEEDDEVESAEEFEEVVAAEPPMPVVEAEPLAGEVEEALVEEPVEETPVGLEEEEPEPVIEKAPEPAEVVEEDEADEEVIEAAHVEQVEEEPQPAAATEEPAEQEEDVVVIGDAHAEEATLEDLPQEAEIEILEEPGEPLEKEPVEELVEEPAIEEPAAEEPAAEEPEPTAASVAVEAESTPVASSEDLEVETSIPLTKAETPEPDSESESDSDTDLPTPPPPVIEDFTDLSQNHVETVVQHITHQMPTTLDLTPETSYHATQEVVTVTEEEPLESQFVSQSHSMVTTSVTVSRDVAVSEFGHEHEEAAGLESAYAVPVVPSECPIAALKSSLPQGDWGFLTEDPEDEQEVKKVWPDSIEG